MANRYNMTEGFNFWQMLDGLVLSNYKLSAPTLFLDTQSINVCTPSLKARSNIQNA